VSSPALVIFGTGVGALLYMAWDTLAHMFELPEDDESTPPWLPSRLHYLWDQDDLAVLRALIVGEAEAEPFAGMKAVADVVVNLRPAGPRKARAMVGHDDQGSLPQAAPVFVLLGRLGAPQGRHRRRCAARHRRQGRAWHRRWQGRHGRHGSHAAARWRPWRPR
jgi:hypothetical protein